MATYRITNRTSGADLGIYVGATAADALDAMARDAGYADHAAASEVAGDDDLIVTEVAGSGDLAAAEERLRNAE